MLKSKNFLPYIYLITAFLLLILSNNVCSAPFFKTNSEATSIAKQLGYTKTNNLSNGQPVYKASNPKSTAIKGLTYITPDVDSHKGGAWKAAKTIDRLSSKSTRLGTYDKYLTKRIGD